MLTVVYWVLELEFALKLLVSVFNIFNIFVKTAFTSTIFIAQAT